MRVRVVRRSRAVASFVVSALILASLGVLGTTSPARASTSSVEITDPDTVTCGRSGLIDFENLSDQTDLTPQVINGVAFTTTGGFTWRVGDFDTGSYNGKYPAGIYTSRGSHWAWLGPDQGSGRMDLVGGATSFFSLLVSNGNTPVVLEAYSATDELLETAGPAPVTTNTGHMTQLTVDRPSADIAYVVVHDSGNFFLVDAICTDAPGVTSVGRYVGLGDSYSSGEGVPPFWVDDADPTSRCHRSAGSYPELIAGRLAIPQTVEHWACSGALIRDFYANNHLNSAELPQLDRLAPVGQGAPEPSLITLTVGGNDIGFEAIGKACIQVNALAWFGQNDTYDPHCAETLGQRTSDKIAGLETGSAGDGCPGSVCSLPSLYRDIRAHAKSAKVVVVGYPLLVPEEGKKNCTGTVTRENGSAVQGFAKWFVTPANFKWIASVVDRLNKRTERLATKAGFTYVDPNKFHSFAGHEACSDDPWFNGVVLFNEGKDTSPYSFHPNAKGQRELADLVAGEIGLGGTDLYVRPGQTVPTQYAVADGQTQFTASSSWSGSDIGMTLTSPSGTVIDRSTSSPSIAHVLDPTNESFTISDPEPGQWTVDLTGLDVPSVGEGARLDLAQFDDADRAPIAVIGATPDRGVAPLQIHLDGSGSSGDAAISDYTWTFDDGTSPETGAQVDHTFATPGTHAVVLSVTDAEGRVAEVDSTFDLSATNQSPVAVLGVETTSGVAPLAVRFDAGLSDDVDGSVVRYRWDFDGDQTIDQETTDRVVAHTYSTGGSYTPRVTVVDDLGATASAAGDQIVVAPPVVPSIPTSPPARLVTSISARASATSVTWGSPVTLSGALTRSDDSPLASALVAVQSQTPATTSWSALTNVVTSATGSWRATIKPGANRSYRVVYVGGANTLPTTSHTMTVAVRSKVTLGLSRAKVRLGTAVTFSGVVAPNHKGNRVSLQRFRGGRWVTEKKAKLSSKSRFSIIWKPDSRKDFAWRVLVPTYKDHAAGASPQRRLTVK